MNSFSPTSVNVTVTFDAISIFGDSVAEESRKRLEIVSATSLAQFRNTVPDMFVPLTTHPSFVTESA